MPLTIEKIQNSFHELAKKLSIADEDADREEIPTKEFHQLIPTLNMAYYFCVSPFRIRKEKDDGVYKIHTHPIQKILTVIFNVVMISYQVNGLMQSYPTDSVIKDPKSLFKTLKHVLQFFIILVCFYILWKKSGVIGQLLQISQQNENEQTKANTIPMRIFIFIWVFSPFAMDIYRYNLWKFSFGKIIQKSKFCTKFYLSQNCTIEGAFYGWPTHIQILGVVHKLLMFYTWILEALVGLIILASALVLYQSSKGFFNRISKNSTDIKKIYMHYRHVGRVTKLINSFIGSLFIIYLLKNFCEHISDIFEVLIIEDKNIHLFGRITYLVVLSQAVLVLLVCAEANRKMGCLQDWITLYKVRELTDIEVSEAVNPESHKIFKLLKMQVEETHIGLGVGSLFTVTYTFLATLLGVFATYAIIQLQFHSENAKEDPKPIIYITLQLNESFPNSLMANTNQPYTVFLNNTFT